MYPQSAIEAQAAPMQQQDRAPVASECESAMRMPVRSDFYLAGPISGLPDRNVPLFAAETARLRSLGYTVVNPLEVNSDPDVTWSDAMRADIRALVECEGVALLPGWTGSRGANLEFRIATALGMRVAMAAQVVEGPAA